MDSFNFPTLYYSVRPTGIVQAVRRQSDVWEVDSSIPHVDQRLQLQHMLDGLLGGHGHPQCKTTSPLVRSPDSPHL